MRFCFSGLRAHAAWARSPCCLAVVTAADRAAATFQRLGTIPVNKWEPEGVAGAIGKLPDGLRHPASPPQRRNLPRPQTRPAPRNANRRGSQNTTPKLNSIKNPPIRFPGGGPGEAPFSERRPPRSLASVSPYARPSRRGGRRMPPGRRAGAVFSYTMSLRIRLMRP